MDIEQQLREIRKVAEATMRIANETFTVVSRIEQEVLAIAPPGPSVPTDAQITQIIKGEPAMSITGTPQGGSSTFEIDALLNGVLDPAGWPAGTVDTWTTDDPSEISLGPDSGPDVNEAGALDQVVATASASAAGTAGAGNPPSYNLTVSVLMPAGTVLPAGVTNPIVKTVNVPILPPKVQVPTDGAINQIS
jgi:hypothetical protein